MTELGETEDPLVLMPGDTEAVQGIARALRDRAASAELAGDGLLAIDTGAWEGPAAATFREKFAYEPNRWFTAVGALQTAAAALVTYADTLGWAQRQADAAIRMWKDAEADSLRARSEYEQASASAAPGRLIAPFADPGEAGRQAARETLMSARRQTADAGRVAADFLDGEAEAAPADSRWLDVVGGFAHDVGAHIVNGLASAGNAMLHHPGEVAAAAGGIALTAVSAGGEGLGVALDITGVGAVAGVPLNAVSAVGMVAGVGITAAATGSLMQHAATDDAVTPVDTGPPVRSAPTKTDRMKEHLTDRDLDAARRELDGEVVARKPGGDPWDHVDEVRNAQRGLVNRISQLKRLLGDTRVTASERAEYEVELSEASRLLDHSERYVPRPG